MAISEQEFKAAQKRGKEALLKQPHAISAKFNRATGNVDVVMASMMSLGIPVSIVPDLKDASPAQLSDIEITSSGLGLHWPQLDVDLYVPALVQGYVGRTTKAQAALLGSLGGKAKSAAKVAAARENGKKGGRPKQKSVA